MIKGKIKNGFEFKIEEERLDDYELIELLAEADQNALKIPAVLVAIFGEEQKKALVESLRNENGKVTMTAINETFLEIMGKVQDIKN